MKLNKIKFVLAIATTLSCSNVFAETPNAYADCGIGGAIFKNDTGATLSNIIWDLGTTAVTSATASPDTCEGVDVEAATFILESYDTLAEETAKGVGSHLDTLLSMVEIPASKKDQVIESIRTEMAAVVASDAYLEADKTEKANFYYNGLMKAIGA